MCGRHSVSCSDPNIICLVLEVMLATFEFLTFQSGQHYPGGAS